MLGVACRSVDTPQWSLASVPSALQNNGAMVDVLDDVADNDCLRHACAAPVDLVASCSTHAHVDQSASTSGSAATTRDVIVAVPRQRGRGLSF